MNLPINSLIDLLNYLLPGFVTAWVYYALTAYSRPTQFERIVQALIFTLIVQGTLVPVKYLLIFIGDNLYSIGYWSENIQLVYSIIIALFIGLIISRYANNDKFHKILRHFNFTRQTSFPSEWFGVFAQHDTYVVIHLKDGRRLYGFPEEWPSEPKVGHFAIGEAEWLTDNGSVNLDTVDNIIIPADQVLFVEFMKPLEDLNKEGNEDGA